MKMAIVAVALAVAMAVSAQAFACGSWRVSSDRWPGESWHKPGGPNGRHKPSGFEKGEAASATAGPGSSRSGYSSSSRRGGPSARGSHGLVDVPGKCQPSVGNNPGRPGTPGYWAAKRRVKTPVKEPVKTPEYSAASRWALNKVARLNQKSD